MTARPRGLLWLFLSALWAQSCVSVARISAQLEVMDRELTNARRGGALRCAPVELATAEANVDFARTELARGRAERADEHVRAAEAATRSALERTRTCSSKKIIVSIEDAALDGDGDGIPDGVDACPTEPGGRGGNGCPDGPPRDRDSDGVPDRPDRCPDQAEDRDGHADEDGCPDPDNDGDGLLDVADQCPNEAGPPATHGCSIRDRDGDGIADAKDKCPDEPEDRDGFEDEDGCPDLDNDNDGTPDVKDACRDQYGAADNGGCPKQYRLVTLTPRRLELQRQIRFNATSSKIIGDDSFELLRELAQVLKDNPRLSKVRVEGHTDSVGPDAANLKLSQERADAVVSALLKLGVDPLRLEAVGYGETRPIASNATAAGRRENRRIDVSILSEP